MVYLASVVVLCISFSQSIFCMEAAYLAAKDSRVYEKPKIYFPDIIRECPSLRTLCFKAICKIQLDRLFGDLVSKDKTLFNDTAAQTLGVLPFKSLSVKDLQLELVRIIKRDCAVPLFSIFEKQYVPHETKFSLPFIRVSLDKRFVFEYDKQTTKVHSIQYNGQLELLGDLKGKFISASQESKWLLINRKNVHYILELPTLKHICAISEPFDQKKDLIVFNPIKQNGQAFVLKDCIDFVGENHADIGSGPFIQRNRYKACLAKLQNIDKESYIFDIYGSGIQLKYLLCGIICEEAGQGVLYFPRKFSFTKNGDLVLINNRVHGTKQDDAVLLVNRSAQPIELPSCWKIEASTCELSSDGQTAVTVENAAWLMRVLHVPKSINTKRFRHSDQTSNLFEELALNYDGRFSLALHDTMEHDSPSKQPDEHAIRLIDMEFDKSVVISTGNPPIRYFGFSPDGTRFFLIRDNYYYLYSLSDFAPHFSEDLCTEINLTTLLHGLAVIRSTLLSNVYNLGMTCNKEWCKTCWHGATKEPASDELNFDSKHKKWLKYSQRYKNILKENFAHLLWLLKVVPDFVATIQDQKLKNFLTEYCGLNDLDSFLSRYKNAADLADIDLKKIISELKK